MGIDIAFSSASGEPVKGYIAKTGEANAPGIVVVQEWWGVQGQIKAVCDRLALAGFDALAPDLYEGRTVPYHDQPAAAKEMGSLNFLAATDEKVRGAARYLRHGEQKVGLTGFCLGGAVTIIGATRLPEINAAVCFYGIPPLEVAPPAQIKVPFQAHFATRDDWCTPAKVDELDAALKAAGKSAEIYRYEADHGFVNEQRPEAHNRAAAELAWGRMLSFWRKHLS